MNKLRYDEISEAIELMKGAKKYCIEISQYTSEVLPTNINMLLVNYFYKTDGDNDKSKQLFHAAMEILLNGSAAEVYIAVLYFDACLYYEENKKATFVIDRLSLATKIQRAVNRHCEELKDGVKFCNGMVKRNPWGMIENFNKFYKSRYNLSIIE